MSFKQELLRMFLDYKVHRNFYFVKIVFPHGNEAVAWTAHVKPWRKPLCLNLELGWSNRQLKLSSVVINTSRKCSWFEHRNRPKRIQDFLCRNLPVYEAHKRVEKERRSALWMLKRDIYWHIDAANSRE